MFLVQSKPDYKRARWRGLSIALNQRWATWQSFGWMILLKDSSWKEMRYDVNEQLTFLLSILRKRQAGLDAPNVLDSCERAGVGIFLAGEGLKVQGPITNEMREDIKRCKPQIAAILSEVPPWDDAECVRLEKEIKENHEFVSIALHPPEDDVFSLAARSVLADALAAFVKGKAVRRLDHCRRRAEWLRKWFTNLETTIDACRKPGGWAAGRC